MLVIYVSALVTLKVTYSVMSIFIETWITT